MNHPEFPRIGKAIERAGISRLRFLLDERNRHRGVFHVSRTKEIPIDLAWPHVGRSSPMIALGMAQRDHGAALVLTDKIGVRRVVTVGVLLAMVGTAGYTQITATSSFGYSPRRYLLLVPDSARRSRHRWRLPTWQ